MYCLIFLQYNWNYSYKGVLVYSLCCVSREFLKASEMAQQVEALATKPENLSSISGTHMMEGANSFPQVTHNLYMCIMASASTTTKK